MSFEPPEGILDIGNATLRVGKLEVAETSGLNQGLLNIVKNNILINENIEYSSSNTWGIKLPTTWVAEFDVKGHSTTKYVEFNFYNEDKTSNALGYVLNFKDTTMSLMYDTSLSGDKNILTTATIPTIVGAYRKVNIFFERGVISVSIDGTRYLYHKESDGFNQGLGVASRVVSATGGAFVNLFIEQDALNSKFKNLRIVNGRFISDKTSNIAFIGGNLGVGVNSPKEALDIRGNMHLTRVSNVSQIKVESNVVTEYTGPHDRPLRKYPEVALTSASDSGYVTSSSTTVGTYYTWNAFDNNLADDSSVWTTVDNIYDSSDNYAYDSDKSLGGVDGEWLKIELPNKIKPSYVRIHPRTYSPPIGNNQSPEDFKILASNDDLNWVELVSVVGWVTSATWGKWDIPSNTPYKYFAIICTRTIGAATFGLAEIEYYGYEEGSASLDTTLKSVYNVPATTGTQLEVYYDAKDLTTMPGTVTDLAGGDQNGTPYNVTLDSTTKSFVFNGSSSYINSGTTPISGNQHHSFSCWLKPTSGNTSYRGIGYIFHSGSNNTTTGLFLKDGKPVFLTWGTNFEPDYTLPENEWVHVTAVYDGTGRTIYINSKNIGSDTYSSYNINASANLYIGASSATPGEVYNGSIANFRLYSKALNAGQIKELYDYQKDYFLGSKSQVTLYKGHLGVGVTEPSGQLELAGDERLQEYPPRDLYQYETLVEGHGVFCAYASIEFTDGNHPPWEAFSDSATSASQESAWTTNGSLYDTTSGLYTGSTTTSGIKGEWIQLKTPYKIKVSSFNLNSYRDDLSNRQPRNFILLGSNDGNVWEQMKSVAGQTSGYTGVPSTYSGLMGPHHTVNSTKYYSYFRIVVTANQGGDALVGITRIRLFGTPGPTTLDKGSLTLGRSLDVPRVSRYDVDTETPRPEKLVLDLDTTVNSSPTDISGKGNHGTYFGHAQYSAADKAFKFDGTSDTVYTNTAYSFPTGDAIYTISCWVKVDTSQQQTNPSLFYFGSDWTSNQLAGIYLRQGNKVAHDIGSTNVFTTNPILTAEQWHHIVVVKRGTGTIVATTAYQGIFVDGVEITQLSIDGSARQQALGSGNKEISIGSDFAGTPGSFGSGFSGCVSRPQIWNVALEPSEVKKLYNLGRTGRSTVISDTAVGIGKAPEAQLDVRGNLNVEGVITTPQRPVFYAYYSGAAHSANGYTGMIGFPNTRINVGGCFNTSDYKFYAPITGYYWFEFHLLAREGTADGHMTISLFKNGANISSRALAYTYVKGSSDHDQISFNVPVQMNAGDNIYPVIVACDAGVNSYFGEELAHFSGYFIG